MRFVQELKLDSLELKNKSPKTTCMYPFTYVNFAANGTFTPCGASEPQLAEHVKDQKDIFNSPSLKQIRREMVAGERPPECLRCWRDEEEGMLSMRQESFTIGFLTHRTEITGFNPESGEITSHPNTLRVTLPSKCNLQCRTCNSGFSSRWSSYYNSQPAFKEWMQNNKFDVELYEQDNSEQDENFDKVIKFVRDNGSSVRRIEFGGGEPFIQSSHYDFLRELKNKSAIALDYSSALMDLGNGSEDVFEHFQNFREVSIMVSIDGVGVQNDYIRTGSDYRVIEKNIRDLLVRLPNVRLFTYTTVSLYNIYQLIDAIKYTTRLGLLFISDALEAPQVMSITLLPPEQKAFITKSLEDFLLNLDKALEDDFNANPMWRRLGSKADQKDRIRRRLKQILIFMNGKDESHLYPKFFEFEKFFNKTINYNVQPPQFLPTFESKRTVKFSELQALAPKTMCVFPFSYVNFYPNARFSPCCGTKYSLSELATGSSDIFNSEVLTRIRREMVKGERSPECENCWREEDIGVKSMRQESVDTEFLNEGLELSLFDQETGHLGSSPLAAKISLSNDCNIQCRMCNSDYSSRWEGFYKKNPQFEKWLLANHFDASMYRIAEVNKEAYFEKIVEFVQKHGSKLRRLEFIGGEPLIQPIHFRLLKELRKNARNLHLDYSSNLMRVGNGKESVFDYWNEFAEISLTVSIDGVGELNNYIRAGSDYKTVEANLELVHSKLINYELFSYTAISLYNVFDLIDIVKYSTRKGFLFISGAVTGPVFVCATMLPREIKNSLTEKFLQFAGNLESELEVEFEQHSIWERKGRRAQQIHRVQRRLQDIILHLNSADNEDRLTKFFEFDDLYNQMSNRQMKLREVAPQLDRLRFTHTDKMDLRSFEI